jgi:hypothetical protein
MLTHLRVVYIDYNFGYIVDQFYKVYFRMFIMDSLFYC